MKYSLASYFLHTPTGLELAEDAPLALRKTVEAFGAETVFPVVMEGRMRERLEREFAILEIIDRRRAEEGKPIGWAIEQRIIGAHLAELEELAVRQ